MKKEGLTWIGKRTNQFRYSVNGADQWIQPLSIYVAGESIKRGEVVSIALSQDFTGTTRVIDPMFSSDDNLVVKTRTDRHIKACGIAMETVQAGDSVHILDSGRIRYDITRANEYNPGFVNNDRGKPVYVGATPGSLTLDRDSAPLGSRNLIQVGIISETSSNLPTGGYFDIEVQFEGDGRGPLETTQFEVAFGEPFSYTRQNGNLPIKVFAIGQGDANTFRFNFNIPRPTAPFPSLDNGINAWLAIYSSWYAYILIFGNASVPQATTQQDTDRLQYILQQAKASAYKPLYTTSTPPASWGTPHTTQFPIVGTSSENRFVNTTLNELSAPALSALFGPAQDITFISEIQSVATDTLNVQTQVTAQLRGSAPGGPIFIEWDSSLNRYFSQSTYEEQGSFNIAGRAVIADRRFPSRTNILGLLLQTNEHDYVAGETALFLRKGTYVANYDAFAPGQAYYAGIDGRITPYDGSFRYPDAITRVGIAKTSRRLIVDIGESAISRVAGMPIGGIKPLPTGMNVPESGFLLMDGVTVHESEFYPELLLELRARYSDAEIFIAEDQADFRIPTLLNPTASNYYQIKATTYGYEPFTTSSILKRSIGYVSANKVLDTDITDLSFVGPQGSFEEISIDRILPRLFVDIPSKGWREIPAGYTAIGSTSYGFTWSVVQQGSAHILRMDIGSGSGLFHLGDPATPIPLNGRAYRLLIMKPDQFARYSDFDLDIARTTLDRVTPESRFPVNSSAVSTFVSEGVTTRTLVVHDSVRLGDGVSGENDTVIINANVIVNSNISEGTTPTLTINSVTGLIETTAPMSPLTGVANIATNASLVTKKYVDDHRGEVISSSYTVHGIRQGHNNGFDADTIDTFHASMTASNMQIPVINNSGNLVLRRTLQLQSGTTGITAIMESLSATELSLRGGSSNAFVLGLGVANRRFIGNNDGQLELLNSNVLGTNYADIKAAQFRTASSGTLKKDITPFESALSLINNVEIVTYTYIDQDEPQVGFIAEKTDPLLSGHNQDSMNVSSTVGVLIKAVQELSAQNRELAARIERLEIELLGDMK
jgi:hypothetical protein